MENVILTNGFQNLSEVETMEIDGGGISLEAYEIIVLGTAVTAGGIVAIVNPVVGLGIILTGFGMCAQAEEYGRSQR